MPWMIASSHSPSSEIEAPAAAPAAAPLEEVFSGYTDSI